MCVHTTFPGFSLPGRHPDLGAGMAGRGDCRGHGGRQRSEWARPGWGRGGRARRRRRARAAAGLAANAEGHVLLPGGGVKGGDSRSGRASLSFRAPSSLFSPKRVVGASRSGGGARLTRRWQPGLGGPGLGSPLGGRPRWAFGYGPGGVSAGRGAGTLRAARRRLWEREELGGGAEGWTRGHGAGSAAGVAVAALLVQPLPDPVLPLCRPEPGASERPSPGRHPRLRRRLEQGSSGRRCPARVGVQRCAAAGRVNEARRRGRRRWRWRRCGD